MRFMVMSCRRGEPRPGGVAPSCPGTLLSSGTALLWLLVGNPERGLPGGVAGAASGDLLFIWGQELRQGGWEGTAASSRPLVPRTGGLSQFGMGTDHPSHRSSVGPTCLPAHPCGLAALDLIDF